VWLCLVCSHNCIHSLTPRGLHCCACRRDLFTAIRLALAKLTAGGAGDEGDAGGMPTYGTRVTINTGE